MRNRAVITGIGVLSPLGNSAEEFFRNAVNGTSAVSKIKKFDVGSFAAQIGGELSNIPSIDGQQEEMPSVARWSVIAAESAIVDANLELSGEDSYSIDVVLGVSISAADCLETHYKERRSSDFSSVRPAAPVLMNPAAAAIHVSRALGLHGELINITTACSSTASAIAYAARLIQFGESECVITGGAEESITPLFLGAFGNGKCLSRRNQNPSQASRPFDKGRDGYVLSDAACILVVEEYSRAQRRNAPIYCEISGVGGASDSASPFKLAKSEEPGARAIEKALYRAQRGRDEVDYYCAVGASDPWMDIRETRMVKRVFRERAPKIAISSVKSMMGHPLGAAGAIQAATAALSIKHSVVPPTINYEDPDPECDLDYVPNTARALKVRNAVVYTIGNTSNSALLLSAC